MEELVQEALAARGIDDGVVAVGEFNPRGHSGGMFAGGLAGDAAGGLLGEAGSAAGLGVGSLAGMHSADARSGLPETMLVGVSATMVYASPRPPGAASPRRWSSRSRGRASPPGSISGSTCASWS
ncbi:MAG: hypothetical protein ACJ742_15855 [Actinomycetes bacterium]